MQTYLLRRFARPISGKLRQPFPSNLQLLYVATHQLHTSFISSSDCGSPIPTQSESLFPYSTPSKNTENLRDRPIIALGIETSCDDTCAAIVTSDRRILSEVLQTQHHIHEPMGGIVPKLAHHAHMRNLPNVVRKAIQKARLEKGIEEIDIIAVTRGPGLAHSLGVGLNAAKTLAAALNKPLIGVHHMEAHALTARLTTLNPSLESEADTLAVYYREPNPHFPYLSLLVSGGHTLLLITHSVNKHTTLASTMDDSIGEAFDKTARELDIPWLPGREGGPGASLEAFAYKSSNPERYLDQLPIPMSLRENKHEMKFSFAGLKSAVTRISNYEKANNPMAAMDEHKKMDLAAGFQHCAISHLCQKVELALIDCNMKGMNISSLVISGGVGRNATLRRKMEEICRSYENKTPTKLKNKRKLSDKNHSQNPVQVICPPPKLCTDNAVMIAWTGIERYRQGLVDPYDIDIAPKWPLDLLGTSFVPE